jgi:hypothetical protein
VPYGAPPQQPPSPYGAPPQPPPAYGQPPQPPPQYGAPPQAPTQFGQSPPQPPQGYGQPQQPPGGYQQPPAYGQPPQPPPSYGQPQQPPGGYQQPQQPQQPPGGYQHPQYSAPAQHQGGGAQAALARIPTSAPGTLFGIPFSLMKDRAFLNKVLGMSAIALAASRFIPVGSFGAGLQWTWSGDVFGGFIFPLIAAAIYAGVALAPKHIQEKIPPVVLQWGPFAAAYIGTGLSSAAVIGARIASQGAGGGLAWLYPILIFGLLVRLQDEDDMVARVFIAIGAIGSLAVTLTMFGVVFHFSGMPILFILHNILQLLVSLVATLSIVFAIPTKWVPALEPFQGFAPLATAILIVWMPISVVLVGLGLILAGAGVLNILLIAHGIILQVAFVGVLLLTAPAAFAVIKNMLQKAGVSTSASAYNAPGGGGGAAPPPPAQTVEQKIAELDAAWHRGGMTPEEYQQRRANIMAGR